MDGQADQLASSGSGASAAPLPPSLFQRSSSSSLSQRSSSTHRSPVLRAQPDEPGYPKRFASSSSAIDEQGKLLYQLEAEEEALVNSLSRKLEKLRAEKVELESTLEMEQEQLVNRLQRQLSQLLAQQQASQPSAVSLPSSPTAHDLPLDASSSMGTNSLSRSLAGTSPLPAPNLNALLSSTDPLHPSSSVVLEALQSENSNLRERLSDAELTANRANRTNELYRQELIELRARAGLDVSDLIQGIQSMSFEAYENSIASGSGHSRRGSNPRAAGGIRIPGVSNSPPYHSRSVTKSSYSPSIYSALSPSTPYSVSPQTINTTPSTSYTTPRAPASTPVYLSASLPLAIDSGASSTSNTPYGSTTSSSSAGTGIAASSYRVPPPSLSSSVGQDPSVFMPSNLTASPHHIRSYSPIMETSETLEAPGSLQRRLSASRNGARVAETGVLKRRGTNTSNSSGSGVNSGGTGNGQA